MELFLKDHLEKIPGFLAVSEKRSFRKAAVTLGITQPALTRQVAILEGILGKELLKRGRQGVELTEAGALLQDFGRSLILKTTLLEKKLRGESTRLSGRISLGTFDSLSIRVLPKIIAEFRSEYPRLRIDVLCGDTKDLCTQINNGDLDFALVTKVPKLLKQKNARMAFKDAYGFFCSPQFATEAGLTKKPLSHGRLRQMPVSLVQTVRCTTGDTLLKMIEGQGIRFRSIFAVDTFEAAANHAMAGVGISVLPYILAEPALKKKKLVSVETDAFPGNSFGAHEMVLAASDQQFKKPTCALFQQEFLRYLSAYVPTDQK